MSEFQRFVKLLEQTDGRDKILKAFSGVFKALGSLDTCQSRSSAFGAVGKSIGDARCLLRMAKWVGDVPKMQNTIQDCRAKGKVNMKEVLKFLRVLCNFLYVLGDNVAFVARYNLLALRHKSIHLKAKTAQFWGFFLAAVLDVVALYGALQKRASDPATSKKEMKAALISFVKDASDTLVTMAFVGYLREVWRPSATTSGALTAVAGGVATYLNWNKIK
ncbi:glycosomal membrane protein [Trypanosoma equiperdum]|uniref:Glycosomal membrane protein, putative n=2 Tax=Trypanozoon TaxID=39700 RepID=Q383C6_TRYB2|nr:glycosomal membrane protein, putative [Trypanosoma brucei brucei TREU927]EAN80105.1 glycosomal membrane protein, putative [Trypanosoma brucei brucei TREU927]SCU68756.1 glycosomal membrane protein [Trypanosoma equiperdum]